MWEWQIFNTRNQQHDETIDHYVTDLKIMAKSSKFGMLTDRTVVWFIPGEGVMYFQGASLATWRKVTYQMVLSFYMQL